MTTTNSFEETRWAAALGTAIARATSPDPMTPGMDYHQGQVTLAFCVRADGTIADIRVVEGSGNASLDRRAIAKLRRAEPLPAGPTGTPPRTQIACVSVAEPARAPRRRAEVKRSFATA